MRSKLHSEDKTTAMTITANLSPPLQYSILAAQEKGSSSWLSALPLDHLGFDLHKGTFRDALRLRYGWPLPYLPQQCPCGSAYNVDHALTCRLGGFPTLRHNQLRNFTANLLKEVCNNISTEPVLQPLSGEHLTHPGNNRADARLDIKANGFWRNNNKTAFLISGFSTLL